MHMCMQAHGTNKRHFLSCSSSPAVFSVPVTVAAVPVISSSVPAIAAVTAAVGVSEIYIFFGLGRDEPNSGKAH